MVGWCHHQIPKNGSKFINLVLKVIVYPTFNRLLFLSQLNLEDALISGDVQKSQALCVPWGAQLSFYNHYLADRKVYEFISTGKENRDFETVINGFALSSGKLHIYMNNNAILKNYIGKHSQIDIRFVENNNNSYVNL